MDDYEPNRWDIRAARKPLSQLTATERDRLVSSLVGKAVNERSMRYQLLRAFIEAAFDYGVSVGANVETFENEIAPIGTAVETDLYYALRTRDNQKALDPDNYWFHNNKIMEDVRAGRELKIWNKDIANVAEQYLGLPYRVPIFERLLVDVLIAGEMYAFFKEAFGSRAKAEKEFWLSPSASSMLRPHPLWVYLKGVVGVTVILGGLAGILGFAASHWSDAAVSWVMAICALLFVVAFGIATLSLPFEWAAHRKTMRGISDVIMNMNMTYLELDNSSVVSTPRLREVVVKASDVGVGWPPSLFAVLDDNIRRRGQLAAPIFGVTSREF